MKSTYTWQNPVWITAITGLIGTFLTIPIVTSDFLSTWQDIKVAEVKADALKQDQEFKIVNTTLSKQGAERVFVLRYLAATLDDKHAKDWAAGEVKTLDTLSTGKQSIESLTREVISIKKALKEDTSKGGNNTKQLQSSLATAKFNLETKKSEVAELTRQAGLPAPTKKMIAIRVSMKRNYKGKAKHINIELGSRSHQCKMDNMAGCLLLTPSPAPSTISITSPLISITSSLEKDIGRNLLLNVSRITPPDTPSKTNKYIYDKHFIPYNCTETPSTLKCSRF